MARGLPVWWMGGWADMRRVFYLYGSSLKISDFLFNDPDL
jgi:hypothetical protein